MIGVVLRAEVAYSNAVVGEHLDLATAKGAGGVAVDEQAEHVGIARLLVPRVLILASSSRSASMKSMLRWTMRSSGTQAHRSGGRSMSVS